MGLRYLGTEAGEANSLAYKEYVDDAVVADLGEADIDNAINTALAPYATKVYVDAQDALLATAGYVDTQDDLRVKIAQKEVANGVAALDATGKVDPSRINIPSTQKYPRGPWTPSAYNATLITDLATETTLYTCPVTDPGYPYRLMVFGYTDARSFLDSEHAIANVRVGAVDGEIIAQGRGASDASETSEPAQGDEFSIVGSGLGAGWSATATEGTGGQYNGTGTMLEWVDATGQPRTWRYRRIDADDALTLTDYQRIKTEIGSFAGELASGGGDAYVRLCLRMNAAEDYWVGLKWDGYAAGRWSIEYAVGGSPIRMRDGVNGFVVTPDEDNNLLFASSNTTVEFRAGTYAGGLRHFQALHQNSVFMEAWDTSNVTSIGAPYRGWGFFGHADMRGLGFGQTTPPDLKYMRIGDCPPGFAPVNIIPYGVDSMTPLTGATTLYVQGVRSGAAATVMAGTETRLHVIAVPA